MYCGGGNYSFTPIRWWWYVWWQPFTTNLQAHRSPRSFKTRRQHEMITLTKHLPDRRQYYPDTRHIEDNITLTLARLKKKNYPDTCVIEDNITRTLATQKTTPTDRRIYYHARKQLDPGGCLTKDNITLMFACQKTTLDFRQHYPDTCLPLDSITLTLA